MLVFREANKSALLWNIEWKINWKLSDIIIMNSGLGEDLLVFCH